MDLCRPRRAAVARAALVGFLLVSSACLEPNKRFDGPATDGGTDGGSGATAGGTGEGTAGQTGAAASGLGSGGGTSGTVTVGTDGASGGATAGTSTTGASTAGTGGGTDCPNQQAWCSNGQGSGTCVNLQIDPENCGECGNACDPGESCLGGECKGG